MSGCLLLRLYGETIFGGLSGLVAEHSRPRSRPPSLFPVALGSCSISAMLTRDEKAELKRHEQTIATARRFRLLEAQAFKAIRDHRLYRATHETFEDYCRFRWGFTRIQGHRLCAWAEVAENLLPFGYTPPSRESHARPLSRLTPEQQRKAWSLYLATKPVIHKARHIQRLCKQVERMPVNAVQKCSPPSDFESCISEQRMLAPISWYGSKSGLAERIVSLLPPHLRYVEAFCGSAAVLLRKRPSQVEVINDLDGDVVNLFRVLRDEQQSGELKRLLHLTPYSRDEFNWCMANPECDDPVEKARRFFVRCRQSYAGIVDQDWSFSALNNRASQFATPVDQLDAIAERFRRVQVENTDFRRLLKKCDQPDTVIYLDPPYLVSGDQSAEYEADPRYRHVMSADDHVDLLEIVTRFKKTKVLLSGYRSRLYDQHLSEWKRYEFPVVVNAAHTRAGNDGSIKRVECVWANY